ncbi:MAG TPA: hypothetical protein VJ697_12590 [Nitrososphaeraceae archaeon]|nr:hypothetical protein [Nitrososphaeraceae archaeon]
MIIFILYYKENSAKDNPRTFRTLIVNKEVSSPLTVSIIDVCKNGLKKSAVR